MPQIYSTSSNSAYYCLYAPQYLDERGKAPVAEPRLPIKKILIRGGANVAVAPEDKKKQIEFAGRHTAPCVNTYVSKEDLELLLQNKEFNKHVKDGFLKIVHGEDKKIDLDKHAKSMEQKDKSSPLTLKDFKPKKSEYAEEGFDVVRATVAPAEKN
jgi:hypothetical protein